MRMRTTYTPAQVGCGDEAPTGLDLLHLQQSVCQTADHVCRVVQVTCLVLVQFGQGGEGVRKSCVLDYCPEWLYACGVGLKERDFGVAACAVSIDASCDSGISPT